MSHQRHINLVHVDATDRFLTALAGVTDPEEKRRRIGRTFIEVFETEARRLGDIDFLAQGTLYPDVIESTSRETPNARTIKTHHNVGGLPADLRFQLVEPLRYGGWAPSWGFPRTWSGASPSPDRGWRSG